MELIPTNEPTEQPQPAGFTFSYKAFEQLPVFIGALQKVYACKAFPNFKSAYRIKRLGDALQAEVNNYIELRKQIPDVEDQTDEEAVKAQKAKLEDLYSIETHIQWNPISEAEINCVVGISPADTIALEYVCDPALFAEV